jgi:hypothetical protein
MKLISFQHCSEGERLADAAIVLWRRDTVRDGLPSLCAFGIAVMLPAPILGKYWDAPLDALMRGWRVPRVLAYLTRPRAGPRRGHWIPAFRCWMHEVGKQDLLAYRWQIEDGIYLHKEGVN